jgi:hypothetical protein
MVAGSEDARVVARDPRPMTSRARPTVSAGTSRPRDAASYVAFREALLDLVDEPTPANVLRYLGASGRLERAHSPAREARASAK